MVALSTCTNGYALFIHIYLKKINKSQNLKIWGENTINNFDL